MGGGATSPHLAGHRLVGLRGQCHHAAMLRKSWLTLHPKSLAACLVLLGFTVGLFAYTVQARRPWFGKLSFEHHQWLTANTLRFARAWHAEGPWALRFALLNEPRSVEFPTLLSRNPYVSYPPGFVLTAYAYSLVSEGAPTVSSLMSWNLINHGLIAVALGGLSLLVLRRLGLDRGTSTLLATVPPTLELLLPGALYWHQNVYFADQAVLLPYVLFILLEAIRDAYPSARASSNWWQALTMAWGLACDWLFVCLVGVAYVKRLATGDIPPPWSSVKAWWWRSLQFGAGGLLALSLFFVQLAFLGMLPRLKERFLERIGATDVNADFTARFNAIFWGGNTSRRSLALPAPRCPLWRWPAVCCWAAGGGGRLPATRRRCPVWHCPSGPWRFSLCHAFCRSMPCATTRPFTTSAPSNSRWSSPSCRLSCCRSRS